MTPSCTAHYFETRELFTYSLVERTALVKKAVTEIHEIFRLYFPGTQKYGKFIEDTILEKQERIVESFALRKISIDELTEIRKQNISGFVLKENNKYYFTQIPKNLRFIYVENFGLHMCAHCNHMSADSDENGGCQKVRIGSNHIEFFDWIESGYETFHTRQDSFLVSNCSHHCTIPKRARISKSFKRKLLRDFEDYAMDVLYPDPTPTSKRDPNA